MQGVANVYDYHVTQSQFDGDNKETTNISARVTIFCVSGQHRLYIKNQTSSTFIPVIDGMDHCSTEDAIFTTHQLDSLGVRKGNFLG